MKNKVLSTVFVFGIAVLLFSTFTETAVAHPGRTDSNGGHYCWTNCASWGEVYGQWHSHGGGSSSYTPSYTPVSTYKYNSDCPSYGFAYLGSCYELPSNSKKSAFSGFSCNYGYDEVGYGLSKKCLPSVDNGYRIGDSIFCNYGYKLSYGSCIKNGTNYGVGTGYTSSFNFEDLMSCPKNSSVSISDYTKCSCDTGYELNSKRDGCKKIKKKTASQVKKSNNKICTAEFGKNSMWDGESNQDDSVMCQCKKNYVWNTDRTSCSKVKKS